MSFVISLVDALTGRVGDLPVDGGSVLPNVRPSPETD